MHRIRFLLLALVVLVAFPSRAQDRVFSAEDNGVQAKLFLPADVAAYRGLLIHVANYKLNPSNRWTELCRELEFGHLVLSMDMKRNNRPRTLAGAIDKVLPGFAEKSGHPELVHLPIMGTGHSAGGMVVGVLGNKPERMLTTAIDCSWVADSTKLAPALREIPLLFTLGAIPDGFNMIPAIENNFDPARKDGWLFGLGFEWGKAHSFANAGALFVPWMKGVASLRLPGKTEPGQPVALRPMKQEDGWLGDRGTWESTFATVAPWAEYTGDKAAAVWLPDRATAYVWRAYQVKNSPIHLTAVSGDASLGAFRVGREFQMMIPVGQDVALGVTMAEGAPALAKVEYFSGDQLLGEAHQAPWAVEWKNPPQGAHPVFAQVRMADGTPGVTNPGLIIVRKPTEVVEVP